MNKLRFMSLGSGSSGNCYYIGNSMRGILIDAGIGARTIKKTLKAEGIQIEQILAIFVTHDHFDHVKSIPALGNKEFIPVYGTRKVLDGINTNVKVREKLNYSSQRAIEYFEVLDVCGFIVSSFPLSHDSSDICGYRVEYGGHVLTIATDLGETNEHLNKYVSESDILILEANYDEQMLKNGPYPPLLKERVAGRRGHLSNVQAADIIEKYASEKLTHIFLCHISHYNNKAELAYNSVISKLKNETKVEVLPRTAPTSLYVFD